MLFFQAVKSCEIPCEDAFTLDMPMISAAVPKAVSTSQKAHLTSTNRVAGENLRKVSEQLNLSEQAFSYFSI